MGHSLFFIKSFIKSHTPVFYNDKALRKLLVAVLLFVIGSVGDNLTTYWMVVVTGRYREANPFAAPFIVQPLYMWFLRDFAFLALAVAASLGCRELILWLSRNNPPPRRARIIRAASRYWIIVFAVGIVRLLPMIHNLVLLGTGYESPLSSFFKYAYEFMNW